MEFELELGLIPRKQDSDRIGFFFFAFAGQGDQKGRY